MTEELSADGSFCGWRYKNLMLYGIILILRKCQMIFDRSTIQRVVKELTEIGWLERVG